MCARLRTHYREIANLTPRNVSALFGPVCCVRAATAEHLVDERARFFGREKFRQLPAFRAFELDEIEQILRVTRVVRGNRGVEISAAEDATAEECFITVRGAIQQVITQDEAIECVTT